MKTGTTYFASGSNHRGEIEGFAAIGHPVGIAINELRSGTLDALKELAGSGLPIFVDSGAFSEVKFGPAGPEIVAPIADAEWNRRLDGYEELATELGSQLYPVAPDMVGNQEVTLDRLARYSDRVEDIRAKGANILVPLQKGALTLAECDEYVEAILGHRDYIPAIPMAKDATSLDDLVGYIVERKPTRIHLLGLGPRSPKWERIETAVRNASPSIELFCDSVVITALVGRSEGKPRPLTKAQDEIREELGAEIWAAEVGDFDLDYTDHIIEYMDSWIAPAALKRIAAACVWLSDDDRRELVKNPIAFFQDCDNRNDWEYAELDREWHRYQAGVMVNGRVVGGKGSVITRKRESIKRALGTEEKANNSDSSIELAA